MPSARADFNLKPLAKLLAEAQMECDTLFSPRLRSQYQEVLASGDLLRFSRETTLEGFAQRLGSQNGSFPKQFSDLSKQKQKEVKSQPWFAASIPVESYRIAAYEQFRSNGSRERLKEFSGFTSPITTALQKVILRESQRQPKVPYSDQELYLLCGSTGSLLEVKSCVSSLKAILNEMMPINGSNYVLMEETGRFLLEPLHVRGVAKAASKISAQVDQAVVSSNELFSVLQE